MARGPRDIPVTLLPLTVVPAKAGTQGNGAAIFECVRSRTNRMSYAPANSEKIPCVYILASWKNGTLYIGVTSGLARRAWQHKNGFLKGFTKRYAVQRLVWFETHPTMQGAIEREKQMKEWQRSWKIRRIEEMNRDWIDLNEQIL